MPFGVMAISTRDPPARLAGPAGRLGSVQRVRGWAGRLFEALRGTRRPRPHASAGGVGRSRRDRRHVRDVEIRGRHPHATTPTASNKRRPRARLVFNALIGNADMHINNWC